MERVAATGEAIVVPDIEVEHQYKRIVDLAPQCASVMAVPLQYNGAPPKPCTVHPKP